MFGLRSIVMNLINQFITRGIHHQTRNGFGTYFFFHFLTDGFYGTGLKKTSFEISSVVLSSAIHFKILNSFSENLTGFG